MSIGRLFQAAGPGTLKARLLVAAGACCQSFCGFYGATQQC